MLFKWTNSEKLKLLTLHKDGVDWASSAEKMNDEYRERPKNFFNEKNCKAEFDRICSEACPKQITPDKPTQSFKKSTVIDAWITHLKELVTLDVEQMVEVALVDFRRKSSLIEKLMSKDNRPSAQEMTAMLAKLREENDKSTRDPAQNVRVESAFRAKVNQIFETRRESDGNSDVTMPPGSLSISPTKPSTVALQQAFRSPSPIKSPITSLIRPLAEVIEEADAEMIDAVEDPKMEMETPVASPLSKAPSSSGKRDKEKSSTVSPRTAADRAIGEGGLEEEMEEEEEEEEIVKEEVMEVDEKEEEEEEEEVEEHVEETKEEEKPMATRKSTRVSTTSVEMTPVKSGREKKRKDPSPQSSESTTSKKEEESKEKEKEEANEEEGRVRRSSMRGRPPVTPIGHHRVLPPPTPPTPVLQWVEKRPVVDEFGTPKGVIEEREEGGSKTRRSSRVEKLEEKIEEKKEVKREVKKEEKKDDKKKEEKKDDEKEEKEGDEGLTKRVTRRSAVEKEVEKPEEKEPKEEVTFVAPSVTARTRGHRGSEQIEEKEKSEEPSTLKTRSGGRHSLTAKSGSESKESPVPIEKKTKRAEKKEDEIDEKESRARKEISVAVSDMSLVGTGGKKDAEMVTEVSIRHPIAPSHPISPSKTRRGIDRASPSTPVGRKSSRVSSISSASGKVVMVSVEVQTDKVEMKNDDEVFVFYNSNEHYFNPVCDVERGRGRPRKEIKTETEEEKEKPISRRTRGGEVSEDEGGSRSGSFSQSEKGTPARRKESKRDQMTLYLDVDDDTGRYWLANGATHAETPEESPAPPSAKRNRALVADISGRRSVTHMDPMRQALFKACKDMELHRHSSVFKANVAQKDAPDYYDCVHQPVCLSKIKTDLVDGKITDPVSLMRQFAIMFMNGAMYNSTAHDYWMYAVEMNKESYKPIREILPAEMIKAEEEEGPKLTRARRNNEPAFAKDAVLCDRDRSMTLDRFFKSESVDGDEMDTSNDDHRALYTRNKVDSTRKRKI